MSPLVSIITPAYNSSGFIGETIAAIQAQSFKDWELLITDDCSTDDTAKLVDAIAEKDPRIKLSVLERNSGAAVARNEALARASGRYIAFCDSDDIWTADKLEKQLAFMQERQCGLSFTSYHKADNDGNIYRTVHCPSKISYRQIKRFNSICCLTALYDTAMVGKVPAPLLRKRQDWALWIKVLEKCSISYGLDEALGIYRVRKGSLSKGRKSSIEGNIAVFTEVLGYPRWRAVLRYWLVTFPNKL